MCVREREGGAHHRRGVGTVGIKRKGTFIAIAGAPEPEGRQRHTHPDRAKEGKGEHVVNGERRASYAPTRPMKQKTTAGQMYTKFFGNICTETKSCLAVHVQKSAVWQYPAAPMADKKKC